MNKSQRTIRGVTLIELIVTLAVLGILMSIGVAAYSGIFSEQELIQRTERLYHFLRLARSQSIKHNKKVYVHFCQLNGSATWKMAMAEESGCDCFSAFACQVNGVEVVEDLADGKTIFTSAADITFSAEQVSFSPMRFSVNAGSVTLSDISGAQLKVIQSTMRLRICSPKQARLGYEKC